MSNNSNSSTIDNKRKSSSDDKIKLEPNKKSLSIAKNYFAKFELVRSRENGLGEICIVGVDDDDDDDDEGNDGKDNNNNETNDNEEEGNNEESKDSMKEMSEEQADSLRYIILTQRRVDLLDEKEKIVLNDQYGQDCPMFNTDFSKHIIQIIEEESNKYNKIVNLKLRFDHLFTFTRTIANYDYWMQDHEDLQGLKKSIGILAKAWLKCFSNNSEKLGIDIEYTYPGVVQMLKQFQYQLSDDNIEFKFGY